MINKIQLLKDPGIEPTDKVLEDALGKDVFAVYKELINTMDMLGLVPEWRYYNDGKAWLCKVVYKKKTVFWLSVWDRFIKTSFYFTEKTKNGVLELKISENIKKEFEETRNVGRLLPLIMDINKKDQLNDLEKLIEYKKNLK